MNSPSCQQQQQRLPWHAWAPFGCNNRNAPLPLLFLAGVTDHLAENEPHALSLARSILANVNSPGHAGMAAPWGQQQAAAQQLAAAAAAAVAVAGGGSHGAAAAAAAAHTWEEPRFSPDELRGEAVCGTLSVTDGIHVPQPAAGTATCLIGCCPAQPRYLPLLQV